MVGVASSLRICSTFSVCSCLVSIWLSNALKKARLRKSRFHIVANFDALCRFLANLIDSKPLRRILDSRCLWNILVRRELARSSIHSSKNFFWTLTSLYSATTWLICFKSRLYYLTCCHALKSLANLACSIIRPLSARSLGEIFVAKWNFLKIVLTVI